MPGGLLVKTHLLVVVHLFVICHTTLLYTLGN